MKIGVVGCGQFAGSFARLWNLHPDTEAVFVTDLIPERATALAEKEGFAGTMADFEEMVNSDVDAIALMTQRWTHGSLAIEALRAGKHVYSAVPMATTRDEVAGIIDAVTETGKVYMMGETHYYYPVAVWARQAQAEGRFGRLFYAEGDYVHDMDHGFYKAYQFSGGENWKATASYPPMLYPTHAVGGVMAAWDTHVVSASALGSVDDRGDGVFDREVSMFDNDFSNMSALFETADNGMIRTNEFRRVGVSYEMNESSFRYFGTEGVLEQGMTASRFATRSEGLDITEQLRTKAADLADSALEGLDPALVESFASGCAPVQDRSRLPQEYDGVHNGHLGSHHFLADDFIRAVGAGQQPPVNAWKAARINLPGIVAWDSARQGGARLPVPDHGDCPLPIVDTTSPRR
ncbi:Gfo/Idh/MocA family protein [Propionibacteriaceae bacterium Y2011]|uniref:Gfo/Idh/MocA family protein n=1 Tax=Microlunatus sp. Y2014 TaxID=3418488 RepID=UPI003B45F809